MGKGTFAILIVFFILIIAVVFALQSLFIVQRLGQLSSLAGSVQVKRRGRSDWRPAQAKSMLKTDDALRTGQDSRAMLKWADGTKVQVAPNTTLLIKKCVFYQLARKEESLFRMEQGQIWVRIAKELGARSQFAVETPHIVATVKGTVFSVKVEADDKSSVLVYRGKVMVKGREAETWVPSGQELTLGAGESEAKLRPISAEEEREWQEQQQLGIAGPLLTILKPAAKAQATIPWVMVQGIAEPGTEVTANGKRAPLSRAGRFSVAIDLEEGSNQIEMIAKDKSGDATSVMLQVEYLPPTAQIAVSTSAPAIAADGQSTVRLIATLRDNQGNLVPDATPVHFATDLGKISGERISEGGMAEATLTAATTPGTATITIRSGQATMQTSVKFEGIQAQPQMVPEPRSAR